MTTILVMILAMAAAPSADTLKQVLTQKLKKLTPEGMTVRTVLFQDVRAGTASGNSYPFLVTAVVHDYGPGYPKNRYYGQTCVGHLDQVRFVLSPDEFGGWNVEGAMTPPLNTRECKNNTAEGVASIPLATLQGSQAPAGNPIAAPKLDATSVAAGSYECWANGSARMLLNFTIRSGTQYTGSDGKAGSYGYDAASGRVQFKGGALDGVMPAGFYAIYHQPGGRPTVSFRNAGGSEVSFCQRVQ